MKLIKGTRTCEFVNLLVMVLAGYRVIHIMRFADRRCVVHKLQRAIDIAGYVGNRQKSESIEFCKFPRLLGGEEARITRVPNDSVDQD